MQDYAIKDKCEKCQGTDDLDGIIHSFLGEDNELHFDAATLCKPCREEFEKLVGQMQP
ncbi:MAG TPA: hypothetical protein VMX17_03145 [Candidatus Glassbacteria bacterium]|nr:hypothetical protein [Candidatus Glassbacteria bacterium]